MTLVRAALVLCLVTLGPVHARAQSRFVEAPYVDRVTTDSATLHLRTAVPVTVRVAFVAGGVHLERSSEARSIHEIVVSGLPHDAAVRYRVTADGHRTAEGTFRTAPLSRTRAIDFVALGDCRDGDAKHGEVIRSIRGNPDFVLHLGDYVPTGSSVDEWATFFAIAKPLLTRTSIVPALGNHEIIAPTGRALYQEHFALGPNRSTYFVYDYGGVRILVLDSNAPLDVGTPQHAFALGELEKAEDDDSLLALFVALHQGPFSSGRHGGLEVLTTSGLVDAMRRAGVDLVLSGHDHIYERGESEGLKYVVSGGCGSPLYRPNDRQPYQLVFAATHHHARIKVDSTGIDLDVRRADGSRLERCRASRKGSFHCGGRRVARSEVGTSTLVDTLDRFLPYVAVAIAAIAVAAWLDARRRRGLA